MPAKIVVTSVKGGSRISLLGSSGKELLGSVVFQEPRAKGATLRALKGLLGETVVEDNTIRGPQRSPSVTPAAATKAPAAEAPSETVSIDTPVSDLVSAPKRKAAAKKATAPSAAAPKVAAARKSTKRATARP